MARTNGREPKSDAERIRGLTPAEYQAVSRMVRRGETTWEELERRGVVEPPKNESAFRRRVRQLLADGVSVSDAEPSEE